MGLRKILLIIVLHGDVLEELFGCLSVCFVLLEFPEVGLKFEVHKLLGAEGVAT